MSTIFKPFQLHFCHSVLEQGRKFHFTASATLGINLQTGEALQKFDYLKDAFACMGENPLPDMGMPKPGGEFLVSGNFFSPGMREVTNGMVQVRLGGLRKELLVSGTRQWRQGFATNPDPFNFMPIDYAYAFGGEGYQKNPDGIGYKDGLLPCIESPTEIVLSPKDRPDPAGFSVINPMWPQRMRFQGTYNKKHLKKYFPGYPEDHDWKYFLCAPEDQWVEGYFRGDETFEIHNMHPDIPKIQGNLPGLQVRCFLMHTLNGAEPEFAELPMDLDTIWFFPEKMLALLIWRGIAEVIDDEAEEIAHVLLAYEDRNQKPRDLEYYHSAFEKRVDSDDTLLSNLSTEDLIPIGAKCTMEVLQERAFAGDKESAFAKNMDAKADAAKKMVNEKIKEAFQQVDKNLGNIDVPDDIWEHIPDDSKAYIPKKGGLDPRKQMSAKPDPEMKALNRALETIMPGITAGDPKKLDLKNFSFDKIDLIMETIEKFADKKRKAAMEQAKKEAEKTKAQIEKQIDDLYQRINDAKKTGGSEPGKELQALEEVKAQLEENMKLLDETDAEDTPMVPLPRLDTEEIKAQLSQVDPQMMDAMQHLQTMKALGLEDQGTQDFEKQILETMETSAKQVEEGLQEAEAGFKEGYFMSAHFMKEGLSPHTESVESVAERLLKAIAAGEDVSNGDWACVDLSDQNLDGIDFSGAFLEQVNFKGASIKGANLSGSIMARANLENADLSGADLTEANVGGVNAQQANFSDANLKGAKLSKGNFTGANFTRAELEEVESLQVVVKSTNFAEAHMPSIKFLESELKGTVFPKADLSAAVFYNSDITDGVFMEAIMPHCIFADVRLENVSFDGADLSGTCFVATDPQKSWMNNVRFRNTNLTRGNLQGMEMRGADLHRATLESANFAGADLYGADLSRSYAKNAQFRKARLTDARLDDINLMEGSLAKADIVNASLAGGNLYAVDFLRTLIENTDLRDSNTEATMLED